MNEKKAKAFSGWWMLVVLLLMLGSLYRFQAVSWWIVGGLISLLIIFGFVIINPNTSKVFTLFGKYVGTLREDGFFWVNPFYYGRYVSLRAHNFESERLKVNDKRGNPIQIGVVLVWKVLDTFKAVFEVDDYASFVKVQADSAVRKLAGMYAYDHVENQEEITLRSASSDININLERELQERLSIAGIQVLEARIGYLAYAPEIAAAMLKRQQAEAIVSARYKIVDGAIGMVETVLQELEKKSIVSLEAHEKARLVSNLMVVLCSEKETTPVVETTA